MSIFDGLDTSGLYGDLLTPPQKQALAARGLLAAAGAFGQAAMPSRMPIPLGAAFGQAASAMGSAEDNAALNALRGNLVGLQGKQLQSTLDVRQKLMGLLPQLLSGGGDAPSGPAVGPSGEVASPVAPIPSGGNAGGGDNDKIIAGELKTLGYNPAQIAAAIGWGDVESS